MKKKYIILICIFLIVACRNIQHGEYVYVSDDVFRNRFIGRDSRMRGNNRGVKKVINTKKGNICLLKGKSYEIMNFDTGKTFLLEGIDDNKDIDMLIANDAIYVKNGSALYWLDKNLGEARRLTYEFNEFCSMYGYRDGVLTVDKQKNILYIFDGEVERIGEISGHIKGVLDDDTILVLEDGGEYELNLNSNRKKYFARNNYEALEYKEDKVLMVMNPKGSEIGQALDVGIFYEGGLKFKIINVFEPFVYDRKSGKVTKYVSAVW